VTSIAFTSLFLGLVLGTHPVGVAVEGPAAQVAFEVDGRPAGIAGKQPWSADLDLGKDLAPHELVARAFDSTGREVARAEQWLNVPRPPSEASLLLETNAEGRAVAARLTWQSLLGTPPRSIELTFDGRPLDARDPARIALPEYDPDSTHLLSAQVEFSPAVVSRAGIVLGGRSRTDVSSELTGVPVRVAPGNALPPADSLEGWFRKGSAPVRAVAVERGPAFVLVVRDTDHSEALSKLGSGGHTVFERGMRGSLPVYDPDYGRFQTRFDDADRVRFLWPRASRAPGTQTPTELFDTSRDFPGSFAGLHWLLTHVSHPLQKVGDQRFADAVAIAGLHAYAGYTRRAVVLVLGRHSEDTSRYAPALVRAYLAKIHVPLYVWSLDSRSVDRISAAWGHVDDTSTFAKLKTAFTAMRKDLDSQQMVWLEGRHLPQDIVLSERASGVELVR
jgi:hypothetical protein